MKSNSLERFLPFVSVICWTQTVWRVADAEPAEPARLLFINAEDQLYKSPGFCVENPSWVKTPIVPGQFRAHGCQTAQIGKRHTGTDAGFGGDWDSQIVWNRPAHPEDAGSCSSH